MRSWSMFAGMLVLALGPWGGGAPAVAAKSAAPGISFRSASSAAEADGASVEVVRPPAAALGDVLVARVANRDHVSATLTASGWTQAGVTHSSALLKSWVLYRVVTADEPASYTFSQDVSSPLTASILAYTGVDRTDPVDSYVGKVNGGKSTFTPGSVSSSVGNEVAVWLGTQVWGTGDCADSPIDPPTNFPGRVQSCLPATGAGLVADVADHQLGAAGAQPPALLAPAVTDSWVGHSDSATTNVTQLLLLRPAADVEVADAYVDGTVKVGSFSLPDSALHEPSGLAASQLNPGVIYTHSESDDKTMVALSTTDGSVLETFDLTNPGQWDWEDIAVAPCPSGSCVYVGDIGGNSERGTRDNDYNIFRLPEPKVVDGGSSDTLTSQRFRFRYPDGRHNAESLLVDPVTQQIYVVTKEQSGASGVYTFPAALPAPSDETITTLTKVTTLQLPTYTARDTSAGELHEAKWFAQASGGSVHPAADRFLLRTPYAVYEYRGTPGGSLTSAFAAKPVPLTAPVGEGQGEAVAYAADGSAYYTLSERTAPPYTLHRIDRE